MPRDPRPSTAPTIIPTNSLVASGARYEGVQAERIYRPTQDWQREAYRHFEICGEARFAARFFGNAMSRATLGIGKRTNDGIKPVTSGPSVDRLHELFNGSEGREQMLRDIGIHLTIAGECWLVGWSDTDSWEVVSVLEMNVSGTKWTVDYGDGKQPKEVKNNKDVCIRIWTPHPGKRIEADSPFRSALPVLAEIEWLTRHIFAQLQSRLAGNGLLFLPDTITFPPAPPVKDAEGKDIAPADQGTLQGFMRTLAQNMAVPLSDPSSPAALVPLMAQVPPDAVDKITHLQFWSQLDEKALEMRRDAVHRFALGMDLAPEQIEGNNTNPGTGGGNSNGVSHWGMWQIEEQTIKIHVEPMLDMVVSALTLYYQRPLTQRDDEMVTYSTAALRLRPDRSKEAMELYNMGGVKMEVVLRENGFDASDLMDEEEFKTWLLRKIASGSATPEQVQAASAALGVVLETATPPQNVETREARPAPTLEEHPIRPRDPSETVASLLPACESLALTALSRAGARMRQTAKRKGVEVPESPAFAVHTRFQCNGTSAEYLADAFPHADIVLGGVAQNPVKVVETLKGYCHALLTEQAPHSRDRLAKVLADAGC